MSRLKLTVILRDDGPMFFSGDSPTYRSVQLELTEEQSKEIEPQFCYQTGGTRYYEQISKCFIEPPKPSGGGIEGGEKGQP